MLIKKFKTHRCQSTVKDYDYSLHLLPGDSLLEEVKRVELEAAPMVLETITDDKSGRVLVKQLCAEIRLTQRFAGLIGTYADWILAAEEMFSELAVIRTGADIRIANDVLDKIVLDNLPLSGMYMRQINVSGLLMSAKDSESIEGWLEKRLAEEIATSVTRAKFRNEEQVREEHRDLLIERRLLHGQIAHEAFKIWCDAHCTHGHDVEDWRRAEDNLLRNY